MGEGGRGDGRVWFSLEILRVYNWIGDLGIVSCGEMMCYTINKVTIRDGLSNISGVL